MDGWINSGWGLDECVLVVCCGKKGSEYGFGIWDITDYFRKSMDGWTDGWRKRGVKDWD